MDITLRPVTEKDIKMIYKWRNDPEIRKMMFDKEEIKYNTHKEFWSKRIIDKNKYSFIIFFKGNSAGMVRLDPVKDGFEIGIIVDPKMQGRGIGKIALGLVKKKAFELGAKKLVARIKKENEVSKRTFENAGFSLEHLVYVLKT